MDKVKRAHSFQSTYMNPRRDKHAHNIAFLYTHAVAQIKVSRSNATRSLQRGSRRRATEVDKLPNITRA